MPKSYFQKMNSILFSNFVWELAMLMALLFPFGRTHIILSSQASALNDLRISLDPNGLFLGDWNIDPDNYTYAEGVVCDENGFITSIVWDGYESSVHSRHGCSGPRGCGQNKTPSGSLSNSLCRFTALETLNLRGNSLEGIIPDCINDLIYLKTLILADNYFQNITLSITRLSGLQHLDLSMNPNPSQSYRPFPANTLQFKNLNYLNLSSCNLEGKIPELFTILDSLETLDLSFNYLNESIPQIFSSSSSLRHLNLSVNDFTGKISDSIGSPPNLTTLILHTNNLTDGIPDSIWSLENLKSLKLSRNKLSGTLSERIGMLSLLENLDLSMNSFSAQFPDTWSNNSRLIELIVKTNNFSGALPGSLGNHPSLRYLDMSRNGFSGQIPEQLGYLPQISFIDLSNNKLDGFIPSTFEFLGSGCPSGCLTALILTGNFLRGPLIEELTNVSSLQVLILRNNSFSGVIPTAIGKMKNLKILDLSTNSFSGRLPAEISNLTNLQSLVLANCSLSGNLPSLVNLTKLFNLDFSVNQFRGAIPTNFVSENISILHLSNNLLSGSIAALTKLKQPLEILLDNNAFSGEVPKLNSSVISLTNNYFSSVHNGFVYDNNLVRFGGNPTLCSPDSTGSPPLPPCNTSISLVYAAPLPCDPDSVCTDQLRASAAATSLPLNASEGEALYCQCFQYSNVTLTLLDPTFRGVTPAIVDELTEALKNALGSFLDYTFVQGTEIWIQSGSPQFDGTLIFHLYIFINRTILGTSKVTRLSQVALNLEFRLGLKFGHGIISRSDVLSEAANEESAIKHKTVLPIWAIVCISVGGFLLIVLSACVVGLCYARRRIASRRDEVVSNKDSLPPLSTLAQSVQRNSVHPITFGEIQSATNNFSDENFLGIGGSGSVYHGKGPDNQMWAVKRLKSLSHRSMELFQKEVKVISQVSHANIVKLIGFCDEGSEQILVYEYISGGTLHSRLHPRANDASSPPLTFLERLSIATGVAEALHYLHTFTTPTIIHRDVKSDNILLDDNMQAKVADFGFLKNVPHGSAPMETRTMGTPGYMDPEYYTTYRVTPKSDVYSFGVVLLELITGRTPLLKIKDSRDENTCITITNWVMPLIESKSKFKIVDPRLGGDFPEDTMIKLIQIAADCVNRQSVHRPDMRTVARRLAEIGGEPLSNENGHSKDRSRPLSREYLLHPSYSFSEPVPLSDIMVGR